MTFARWYTSDAALERLAQHLNDEASELRGGGQPLLIALDWTEWHHDLRMLVAAVVMGCRAIPVQAAAFSRSQILRSQNLRGTTFLRLLVHSLHASVITVY